MMTCGRCFFRDMKNAVPAFRFRFSLVDDALKLLVESCRNTADFVTLVLIVPYAADVSMENSLTLATPSMCRRTLYFIRVFQCKNAVTLFQNLYVYIYVYTHTCMRKEKFPRVKV